MNIDEKRREALRRRVELFRDGKPTEGTVKRRKNTRRILLINIGLLVAIFFTYRNIPSGVYSSGSIDSNQVRYRLSISEKKDSEQPAAYFASFTIQSFSDTPRKISFPEKGAVLLFLHGDTVVYSEQLADTDTAIPLAPGEIKNFVMEIHDTPLRNYARAHPDAVVPLRKGFMRGTKRRLPLTAKIVIHGDTPETLSLKFKYEVH